MCVEAAPLEGESLEERARLERASAGVSSLRGGTAAFLYMDDADQGGQPALKTGGALARAQRLDTVVIRPW